MRVWRILNEVADTIDVALEKHFWLCSTLFAVQFLAFALVSDVRTKMWVDELYTLHMARQASAGEIVKATLEGCDGAPPLYAIVVHEILPWVRNEALAVRLPATLGFCGMILCLLAFCRRRLPAVYSLIAAVLACAASQAFSTEGRGYGVVLGCAAGALLCWQFAAEGKRRMVAIPLLAFCLALMTALHYYSILFLVPLLLAEMARWRKSGKLDLAVLSAMIPVLLVLGWHYPLIAAGKRFQEHSWSPAVWGMIPRLYASYFLKMFLLPLCLVALFSTTPEGRRERRVGLTLPEWVAACAFLLMPLGVVVLSIYTTHVFVARYILWAVVGIAVLISALLCAAARGRSALGVSMLGLLVAVTALHEVSGALRRPVLFEAEEVRQELASLPDDSEPIVVADHHQFMELAYYGLPRLRERLIYPVSRDLDLRYFGNDAGPLLMSALSHRLQLHIVGYDQVLAAHPRFVLAATPGDYLPWHLVKAGYRVVPISSSLAPALFEVTQVLPQ